MEEAFPSGSQLFEFDDSHESIAAEKKNCLKANTLRQFY